MFVPFPRYLYQGINSCISEECSHINKLSFIERMFCPFPSTVPSESNSLLGSAGYKLTRSCSSLPGQAPRVPAGLPCDWALDIGLMDRKKEEERDTCCLTGKVSASLQASGKHQCLQGDMPPVQLQRVWIPEPRYLDAGTQMPPAPILFFPNQGFNLVTLGSLTFCLLSFNSKVMSDSLQPHGLQHTRLPCPALSPGVCSTSCPLSQWCHPTISSSVIPFSSCPQSFPASGSYPMSQLFASGGQSIGASASASVLPMDIQGWFPLGLTGLSSLLTKGLSRDSHLELSYSYN